MELAIIQSKIYEIRGVKVMLDFDGRDVWRGNEGFKTVGKAQYKTP